MSMPLDPGAIPPSITPADSPSSPGNFAAVTPHGQGPAPYDIQAPVDDLAGLTASAGALSGAGVIYPQGPRQAMTEALMQSPAGFGLDGYDIDAGYHGGGGDEGWPSNVEPGG